MCKRLILLTVILLLGVAANTAVCDLVAYYPLDEATGDTAVDASGNGHDGTRTGAAAWVIPGYQGDSAINIDGLPGSRVALGTWDPSAGTGQLSISLWVRWGGTNVNDHQGLVGKRDAWNVDGLLFFTEARNNGTIQIRNRNTTVATPAGVLTPFIGEWAHIAITFDGTTATIYCNGAEEASGAFAFDNKTDAAMAIGCTHGANNGNAEVFKGDMDEVRIYNHALSAAEVQDLAVNTLAREPDPADGAILNATFAPLSWTPGDTAAIHEVYFSEDQAAVLAGAAGALVGTQPASNSMLLVGYGLPGDPRPDGLALGTTYYWRIDEVEADGVTRHVGATWSLFVPPLKAYNPSPADQTALIPTDTDLSWGKGMTAKLHNVYFGTDPDVVANATTGGTPSGGTTFDLPELEPDTTYYWRVDELDIGVADYKGDLWSFRTAPIGVGEVVMERWENISGGAISALRNDPRFPGEPDVAENLASFLWNVTDIETYGARIYGWVYPPASGDYTFRIATDDNGELWLSTDDDPENAALIANVSGYSGVNDFGKFPEQTSEAITLVAGRKYYVEALWKEGTGGDHCHVQWTGPAIGNWATIDSAYLSPFSPLAAYGPAPGKDATSVPQSPTMIWKPGKKAATHQIYLGTDAAAVASATTASPLYKGSIPAGAELFEPGELLWDTTYYWRVDEVNTLEPDSPWKGEVWSFTTADYLVIDDMEDYNNYDPDRIFDTWIDGWGNSANGSFVGHDVTQAELNAGATFVETGTVHGGAQSMPFYYDNNMKYSEATMTLTGSDRDWTQHSLKSLSLWYYGFPGVLGSLVEAPAGTYTMEATGRDIWAINGVEEDEFHFAWKMLNGPGTIAARIVSMTQPNTWTKGGVMIRETLDPNSTNLFSLVAYNSTRFRLQSRPSAAAQTVNAGDVTGLTALVPRWIKLERTFSGDFIASHANDVGGTPDNWTMVATTNVQMPANVYIGMALTSHQYNVPATAVFDNVSTTGSVSGAVWTNQDIGIRSNDVESMYVSIKDGSGHSDTEYNPDPDASVVTGWTQWGEYGQGIALSAFNGVNLADVDTISIGFGAKGNNQPGGSGLMFFDDIRLNPAACFPQLAKPAMDFSDNCVVDMPDLEIMTDNWLNQTPQTAETVWSGSWSDGDIGTVDPAGGFSIDGGDNFTITGDGADIWGTADGLHYAYQSLSGDGHITVRINSITNTNAWAKAGVMIRDTLDPGSTHAMMVITPSNGANFQWRPVADEASSGSGTGAGLTAPICLSIARTGDTFTGYYSTPDGWVQQASATIPMTDPVNIGIAVTSHSSGALCTVTGDTNCPPLILETDATADGVTNFMDYAVLIDSWLDEVLWP